MIYKKIITVVILLKLLCAGSIYGEVSNLSEKVPSSLVSLGDEEQYVLLVEKSTQKLFIYDKKYKLIETYSVTTGQKKGDKMRMGDKKTPEGVYFFIDVIEERDLLPKYGAMALVMNYPNEIDLTKNKKGSGIWLHGTDEPLRKLKPNNTKGCVAVKDEDILEITKYVNLETTPIIIVKDITSNTLKSLEEKRGDIGNILKKWKKSWEGKEIHEYIKNYASDFHFGKMGLTQWKKYKETLNRSYSFINVNINNVQIFSFADYMVVVFRQEYKSNFFSDLGIKRLYLKKENRNWKIFREEWKAIDSDNFKKKIAKN